MVTKEKIAEIRKELALLEEKESITILWACESGSRAWGFESQDSDYDVRFIYLRNTEDYLRASEMRDVIELPISDELDISGWDLPKALGLFRKSNPPLLEWLQSPIIYKKNDVFYDAITSLIPDYFSPVGCMYHYMSMAKRNSRNYLEKAEIKSKRYFYILRPILACMWIEQGLGTPPIEFGKLLNQLLPDGELRAEIDNLIAKKKRGGELDLAPPIPIVSDFIISQMEKFIEVTKETQFTKEWESLDELFRTLLVSVNGKEICLK